MNAEIVPDTFSPFGLKLALSRYLVILRRLRIAVDVERAHLRLLLIWRRLHDLHAPSGARAAHHHGGAAAGVGHDAVTIAVVLEAVLLSTLMQVLERRLLKWK